MKILFLEIETDQTWALASIGPAFIASYIRRHDHEAALLRVSPDCRIEDIIRGVESESPDLLGFSLTTRQYKRALSVAFELRKNLDVPIIAGGLHPTFSPLSVLESGAFDFVCLGEGEEAVGSMLTHLHNGEDLRAAGIPNIWAKGLKRPAIRPPLALERLPFMARDLLNETNGVFHVSTQRGCPFPCTYCAGGAIKRLYGGGNYVRRRSVGSVLEELRQIRSNAPINYVIFLDDTFTLNREWLEEFCGLYGPEIGSGFSINARADTVTPEMISLLAKAGCKHRRVRESILNRPGDNSRFIETFKRTKEAGMLATANFMIGIPGETPEDIEQTLALNEELAPDDFGCFIFHPYPGTPLFESCRKQGYLPENYEDLPADNRQSILTLPGLTQEEIRHYYDELSAVRENSYLKRYGGSLNETQKALAIKNLRGAADASAVQIPDQG
jgi:radical SAM superfamily enzyme YgiQ (UPF0313 family)